MFENECQECFKLNTKLEESHSKIEQLELTNMELKLEISKTSNIISNYLLYKKENESLKKEINILKQSTLNSVNNNQASYEMEIVKSKFLKEREKNLSLKALNVQLSSMIEESKTGGESKSDINKIKKELLEKEKKIGELSSLIEKLKKQQNTQNNRDSSITKKKNYDESLEKMAKDSPLLSEYSHKDLMLENIISDKSNENNHNNMINGNGNNKQKCDEMKSLLEENEFLNRKYRKYQIKYIKFKAKYTEMKNMLTLMSSSTNLAGMKINKKSKSKREESSSSAEVEVDNYDYGYGDDRNEIGDQEGFMPEKQLDFEQTPELFKKTSKKTNQKTSNQKTIQKDSKKNNLLGNKRKSDVEYSTKDIFESNSNAEEDFKGNFKEFKEDIKLIKNQSSTSLTIKDNKDKDTKESLEHKSSNKSTIEIKETKSNKNTKVTKASLLRRDKDSDNNKKQSTRQSKNKNEDKSDELQVVINNTNTNDEQLNLNTVNSSNSFNSLGLNNFNTEVTNEETKPEVSQKLLSFFNNKDENRQFLLAANSNNDHDKNDKINKSKFEKKISNKGNKGNKYVDEESNPDTENKEKDKYPYNIINEYDPNMVIDTEPKKAPLPREKKQVENLIVKKQEIQGNLLNFINSIQFDSNDGNPEEMIENFIKNFGTSFSSYENNNKIFEIIIESIAKVDFIKLLFFLKVYFNLNKDFSKQFKYITELLEQYQNKITFNQNVLIVNVEDENNQQLFNKIFKEDKFNLKNILFQLIQSLNLCSYIISYFISFLIVITFQNTYDNTEINVVQVSINLYKTMIEIFFKNSIINENLFIIKSLTFQMFYVIETDLMNKIDNNFLIDLENIRGNNKNKLLFLEPFAKHIVTSKTINFINQVIDINSGMITNLPNTAESNSNQITSNTNLIDHFIIQTIETYFNQINNDLILNENISDKINFIEEQGYIDIYQTIFLSTKIKVNNTFKSLFINNLLIF